MRKTIVAFFLILFLFASVGRVAAQSPLLLPTASGSQGNQGASLTDTDNVLKLLTLGGTWVLTSVLAYLAWRRWRRDREANALAQLYQRYQDSSFLDALKIVGKFEWVEDNSDNRYVLAEAFLFDHDHAEKRDEARRIVTTFWYRVAFLLDQGVIGDENTFVLFGPPNIVEKLEALEAVKAERLGGVFPVEWPPLALLDRYRRRKIKRHFPTLPLDQEEFDNWKKANTSS